VLAIALVAAVAILRRRPRLALIAAASIAISLISTEFLKLVLLERPPLVPSYIFDNSYPSGHTTVGMSVAIAAMLVVPRRLLLPTAVGAGLFGSAFGVAVVAAGWHRPSDAIGAFLVVLSVAAACAAISYRGIPWTSTSAGFLLSAAAIIVCGLLTALALAAAMLAADDDPG
jgi:membrane-associated phospholipid phosphatase